MQLDRITERVYLVPFSAPKAAPIDGHTLSKLDPKLRMRLGEVAEAKALSAAIKVVSNDLDALEGQGLLNSWDISYQGRPTVVASIPSGSVTQALKALRAIEELGAPKRIDNLPNYVRL